MTSKFSSNDRILCLCAQYIMLKWERREHTNKVFPYIQKVGAEIVLKRNSLVESEINIIIEKARKWEMLPSEKRWQTGRHPVCILLSSQGNFIFLSLAPSRTVPNDNRDERDIKCLCSGEEINRETRPRHAEVEERKAAGLCFGASSPKEWGGHVLGRRWWRLEEDAAVRESHGKASSRCTI